MQTRLSYSTKSGVTSAAPKQVSSCTSVTDRSQREGELFSLGVRPRDPLPPWCIGFCWVPLLSKVSTCICFLSHIKRINYTQTYTLVRKQNCFFCNPCVSPSEEEDRILHRKPRITPNISYNPRGHIAHVSTVLPV